MKKSISKATSSNGRAKAPAKKSTAPASQKTKTGKNEDGSDSLLEKFFIEQLKDIYYAEKKIVQSLPKLAAATTTEELMEAFNDHRHQSEKHVRRVEKVFELLEQSPQAKICEPIDGIVKECEKIISETPEGSMTRDAALIMAAQKIEHYEIATYGGLVQFALTMKRNDIARLLDKTLEEEEQTDLHLTEIAEAYINIEAEEETKYSWNKHRAEPVI